MYEGTPAASSLTWKQEDTQLATTSTSQELDLVLSSVTKAQNGEYTCVVVVGADVVERVVELSVLSESIPFSFRSCWGNGVYLAFQFSL